MGHMFIEHVNVKIPTPKVVVCGNGIHATTFGVGKQDCMIFYKHATPSESANLLWHAASIGQMGKTIPIKNFEWLK